MNNNTNCGEHSNIKLKHTHINNNWLKKEHEHENKSKSVRRQKLFSCNMIRSNPF